MQQGEKHYGIFNRPKTLQEIQACAAVGQCKLMINYQKLFSEYDTKVAQVLITKTNTDKAIKNITNTFRELLKFGVVPIVNENDAVATDEIEFGDNDTLSAIVAALIDADLLILLTDKDGLYTDDPSINPNAKFIETVCDNREDIKNMAKKTSDSDVGTGGMYTKILAANIANDYGTDMIIANSKDVNVINKIIQGEKHGTLFVANPKENFNIKEYIGMNKGVLQ